ncbi:MAG TPA: T9SS type A sorting domain-containing protein [Chitinophagaceae bacterium]|nr:T9SS type A sorting domain-containing protein [Chitinophagaceae bacterium]
MKIPLLFTCFLYLSIPASSQITTAVLKAYFGVDADLKARSLNGSTSSGDDWFLHPTATGTTSNGTFVIDTTGAASIIAGYNTDVSPYPRRMASFYRTMSKPAFTVVNNRLWLDALFVRDYHGTDSTVFTAGSDKNGMSPANWTGGIQGIPDKNDILDIFMHIRRAGPTTSDSLWMFGGLSLDNVTGNRYFDFEMYQTDIYYDRVSKKWYGYGPDEGHTSWEFDAAGNVTKAGDIIFTAEYQSSSLTSIEARIWINKTSLSITPAQFSWSGQFDGASSGAQFGYASLVPKTSGAFYTGLQCGNSEWAGPFSLVLQDNSVATNYNAKQFMEFSVNLSKLGLDPAGMLSSDVCGTPFNRLVIKTRSSASFTAELKDFVAPIDLFLAPRVDALADVPLFCGNAGNVSTLAVQNPTANSVYTWTTPDGHIIGNTNSTSVTADMAGTYVVQQQLMAGCSVYALDTVTIVYEPECSVLEGSKIELRASLKGQTPLLNWISSTNSKVLYYLIERSFDGKTFSSVERVYNTEPHLTTKAYSYSDLTGNVAGDVYYRVKMVAANSYSYSSTARVLIGGNVQLAVLPNPAQSSAQIKLSIEKAELVKVVIYNMAGKAMYAQSHMLNTGHNSIAINEISGWPAGVYMINVKTSLLNRWDRLVVSK